MKLNERMLRGKEIYNQLGQIKKLWNDVWYVKSQSGHGTYTVTETQEGWKCQCPDYHYRQVECKHIWAVKFFLKIKAKVRENHIIEPVTNQACPQCGGLTLSILASDITSMGIFSVTSARIVRSVLASI